MARSFSAWKSKAMLRLLSIKTAHKGNAKIEQDVEMLITKLTYLKARDLHSFISLVYQASKDAEELLSILPTEEEVEEWYGKGEEE
jgi:hypothetical protein